ncbi:MAG: ABC transporter ATP-binding protein, partial [Pirellulaceae bacterium]
LRLIAGLEQVTAGEIRIGGQRVNDVPPWQRRVAMVFQGSVLYPHWTVEQNLLFGWEAGSGSWLGRRLTDWWRGSGRVPSDVRDRVRQSAKLLGIEHLLDRYPRQLSGGERQRVALGRALVRQPAVFLLDEPWSHVDDATRRQVRDELRHCREQAGGAMVLVTHDHEDARAVGDRVAVMAAGRVSQVGVPDEVFGS